jgi:DUF971 family protein
VSEAISAANEKGAPLVLQRCFQDKQKWSSFGDEINKSEEERAAGDMLLWGGDGDDSGVGYDSSSSSNAVANDAVTASFFNLADAVIRRVYEEAHSIQEAPLVYFDPKLGKVVVRWTEQASAASASDNCGDGDRVGSTGGGCDSSSDAAMRQVLLSPSELRAADPSDGSPLEGGNSGAQSCGSGNLAKMVGPMPSSIDARGNYALRIVWEDGYEHPFFTYDAVRAIALRQLVQENRSSRTRAYSDENQVAGGERGGEAKPI